jgi:hypothetical protein
MYFAILYECFRSNKNHKTEKHLMNISLQNLDHKPWGDYYFCLDVCPGHDDVHIFCHLVMNVKANLTLAPFTVVSAYL